VVKETLFPLSPWKSSISFIETLFIDLEKKPLKNYVVDEPVQIKV